MTDKTTMKPKGSLLGTVLTVAATAAVAVIATKNGDKIVAGFRTLFQHMADGSMKFPPAAGMNGKDRVAPTSAPAPAGH